MDNLSFVSTINFLVVSFAVVFLLFLLIGFYILLKDTKSKQNRIFFVWTLSFSIGCLGYLFWFWTSNKNDAYFFSNIAAIGYCTMWPIAIHFLMLFLNEKINKLWRVVLGILYFIGFFYVFAAFTGLSASKDYTKAKYGWIDTPNDTILYPIYVFYVVICIMVVIYLLVKIRISFHKNSNYNKEKQFSIMLITAVPSILLGIFFNIVAPATKMNLPSVGFIFSGIWILGTAYAIVKYKMFVWNEFISPIIVDKFGEIVIVVDNKLNINYVNSIFFKKLCVERCDPSSLKLSDFVSDVDKIVSYSEFANKNIKEKEIDLISRTGLIIKTKVTGIPVTMNRNLSVVIFTFSDITYRIDELIKRENNLLKILAYVADSKSSDFEKHILRMKEISVYIADIYKKKYFNREDVNMLNFIDVAAPLHDIGKFAIPDSILNKRGKLTKSEIEKIREHTIRGYDVLSNFEGKNNEVSALVAKYHHERWDGSGYPMGISGNEIPIIARIVSLADVVDALLTKRVYKDSMSSEEVFEYIKKEGGKSFDPEIVDLILSDSNYEEIIKIYNSYS